MQIGRTVLAEATGKFLASLTATTGVAFFMLAITFLKRTPGVGLGFLLDLFPLFFPLALQFTVPLAALTASVLTFSRMAGDGELTALSACGIAPGTVIRPVLAGAAVLAVCGVLLTDVTGPFAAARLRAAQRNLPEQLQTSLRSGLCDLDLGRARISFESFSGNTFRDVCLEWRESKDNLELWRAETGSFRITEDEEVELVLENWRVVFPLVTEKGEAHVAARTLAVRHPLDMLLGDKGNRRTRTSMQAWQLAYVGERDLPRGEGYRTTSDDANEELARRTALAGSAFFFVLIGIPLGILTSRGGRTGAILLALAPVMVSYFPLVIAGSNLARNGLVPSYPALWSGNLLLAVAGVFLLVKVVPK